MQHRTAEPPERAHSPASPTTRPATSADREPVPLSSRSVHDVPVGSSDPGAVPAPPSEKDLPKNNKRTLYTVVAAVLAIGFGTYVAWVMLQPEPDFEAMPSPFSEEAEKQREATP